MLTNHYWGILRPREEEIEFDPTQGAFCWLNFGWLRIYDKRKFRNELETKELTR